MSEDSDRPSEPVDGSARTGLPRPTGTDWLIYVAILFAIEIAVMVPVAVLLPDRYAVLGVGSGVALGIVVANSVMTRRRRTRAGLR